MYRNTPCNTVFLGVCFNIELKVRRNTRYAGSSTHLVNIFPRKLQDLNLNFFINDGENCSDPSSDVVDVF